MRNLVKTIIILCLLPMAAEAAVNSTVGVGGVANSLMDPVGVVGGFIQNTCLLVGGAFIFASIIKYFEHRRSPTMVPISTVVYLFLGGLLLLALPLTAYLTSNGVHYTR